MNQEEFLDEIESKLHLLVHGYYHQGYEAIVKEIKNYLDERKMIWHPVRRLPTPGIPLKLRLITGEIVDGWRPSYIASYGEYDLGYRTADGEVLTVTEWCIA